MSEYAEPDQNEDMISMFHVDGDRLLMTHYCSAGNQPRMKAAASPDRQTISWTSRILPHRGWADAQIGDQAGASDKNARQSARPEPEDIQEEEDGSDWRVWSRCC